MHALLFHCFLIFTAALWPFGRASEPSKIKETSYALPEDASSFENVRVAVVSRAAKVTLSTPSPYRVKDGNGRSLFSGERIVQTEILPTAAGGLKMGRQIFTTPSLRIDSEEGRLRVNKEEYRHTVEIVRGEDGMLAVINDLPMEEYLKGVLPSEMMAKWPLEALKAQAVAARTYAVFRILENRHEFYAVGRDVSDQVFGGAGAEDPRTSKAVEATNGQILTYEGRVFPAFFHSTCGGATTRADKVWAVRSHPVLSGGKCVFCQGTQHYRWQESFDFNDIETRLNKLGYNLNGVYGIAAADPDAFGRAGSILVKQPGRNVKIQANQFRMAMDPFRFKSTWIDSAQKTGRQIIVQGRGWGHGVGLCQYGAMRLAEAGYTYREILEYYYHRSILTKYL